MIQTKIKTNEPEVVRSLNISKDGKSYQEDFVLLFPKYVSAIDDE